MQRRSFLHALFGIGVVAEPQRPSRVFTPATVEVSWPCGYCGGDNRTPRSLWATVRYSLICDHCDHQQNYPEHILRYDPTDSGARRREEQGVASAVG